MQPSCLWPWIQVKTASYWAPRRSVGIGDDLQPHRSPQPAAVTLHLMSLFPSCFPASDFDDEEHPKQFIKYFLKVPYCVLVNCPVVHVVLGRPATRPRPPQIAAVTTAPATRITSQGAIADQPATPSTRILPSIVDWTCPEPNPHLTRISASFAISLHQTGPDFSQQSSVSSIPRFTTYTITAHLRTTSGLTTPQDNIKTSSTRKFPLSQAPRKQMLCIRCYPQQQLAVRTRSGLPLLLSSQKFHILGREGTKFHSRLPN